MFSFEVNLTPYTDHLTPSMATAIVSTQTDEIATMKNILGTL